MLKGLQYVGEGAGISVMLYKSYKSVRVSWDKPYRFTSKDDTSNDAKMYYLKHYKSLGINIVEERDADTDPKDVANEAGESSVPEVKAEVETPVEATKDEVEAEPTVTETAEVTTETTTETTLDSICKQIVTEYGADLIQSASEGDVGEILDSKFTEDQIYQVAKAVGYDYGRIRKKSKIINGMLESNFSQIVAFILK